MQREGRSRMFRTWIVASVIVLLAAGVLLWRRGSCPGPTERTVHQSTTGDNVNRETVPEMATRASRRSPVAGVESGTTDSAPVVFRPKVTLTGSVRSESGDPIHRALVYVVRKGWRGAYSAGDVPSAGTNESGAFRLQANALAECHVAAIAEGYLPAFMDYETLKPGAPLEFVLIQGPTLLVEVPPSMDVADKITKVSIVTATRPGEIAWSLPGPGQRAGARIIRRLPASGRAVIHVGTRGPIEVRATRFGYFSVPEVVRLSEPQGVARFEFSHSCGVRVRVVDRDGEPVKTPVRFDVIDERSGEAIQGAMFKSPFGEFELADRIAPGTYTVRVWGKGYEQAEARGVVLRQPRDTAEVLVRLDPDNVSCWLSVSFPALLSSARAQIRLSEETPHVLHHRSVGAGSGGGRLRRRWVEEFDTGWDPASATMRILVNARRVDATLFLFPDTGYAAIYRGEFPEGDSASIELRARPGLYWSVKRVLAAKGSTPVHASIQDEEGFQLPLVSVNGSSLTIYESITAMPGPIRIGPFPSTSLMVRVLSETGNVEEDVVRRRSREPSGR